MERADRGSGDSSPLCVVKTIRHLIMIYNGKKDATNPYKPKCASGVVHFLLFFFIPTLILGPYYVRERSAQPSEYA